MARYYSASSCQLQVQLPRHNLLYVQLAVAVAKAARFGIVPYTKTMPTKYVYLKFQPSDLGQQLYAVRVWSAGHGRAGAAGVRRRGGGDAPGARKPEGSPGGGRRLARLRHQDNHHAHQLERFPSGQPGLC